MHSGVYSFLSHSVTLVFCISLHTHVQLYFTRSHSGAKRKLIKEVWRKTLYCVNRTLVFGVFNRSHSGVECELITELGWPRRGLWHSLKKAETDASKRRPHNPARGFQRLLGRSVCIDSSRTLKQTHATVKQSHTRVTRVRLLHERT